VVCNMVTGDAGASYTRANTAMAAVFTVGTRRRALNGSVWLRGGAARMANDAGDIRGRDASRRQKRIRRANG